MEMAMSMGVPSAPDPEPQLESESESGSQAAICSVSPQHAGKSGASPLSLSSSVYFQQLNLSKDKGYMPKGRLG